MSKLELRNVGVAVGDKRVVQDVSLAVSAGEIHAIMGPNGSGKSSLAKAVMGHPGYRVVQGDITLDGESILPLTPTERGRRGIFLGFQYPTEVPGVTMLNFLRTSYSAMKQGGKEDVKVQTPLVPFKKVLTEKLRLLGWSEDYAGRYLNEGFSGGEKKKSELLQVAVLQPKITLLDEIDSGLDIDAVRLVAETLVKLSGPSMGLLMITHYKRILQFVQPHRIHVMVDGRIVLSGGPELADRLEEEGYSWVEGTVEEG
ncbi:MAG: Fe-S cluster assembly ATPase SufC [Nitrososphaerota archaeon]|nr:Fe-S cluster assembly ATPase SufC [Nitrososphaerota archaeon]MDG6939092.1 Fe-S cluster assembly ATPase SufC [Nitrososphaerota archaeon]